MNDEQMIEQQLQDKGLNAPRLDPEKIQAVIRSAQYYVFPNTNLTVCCLTLTNGFSVTGESSSVSVENFDKQVGEEIAYRNARNKVWALEGYLLRQRLLEEPAKPPTQRVAIPGIDAFGGMGARS